MSQLQKRCLFASVGVHALLLFIVAFGSAFFLPKSPPIKSEALMVIPDFLIDEALSGGGGNPNIPKPAEPQVQKGETMVPEKAPEPPKPEPPKPKADKPPEPPKPVKDIPKDPPKDAAKPKDERKVTLSDLKPKKPEPVKPDTTAASKQADSNLAKELARARESLKAGFTKGTVVEPSGPGGAAYASYASFVRAIYDDNWVLTENVNDKGSVTLVEVIIDRDGDVIGKKIVRYSGNGPLDRSVQAVLDKVQHIRPFPEGAREKSRKFTIEFNLRDKLGSG